MQRVFCYRERQNGQRAGELYDRRWLCDVKPDETPQQALDRGAAAFAAERKEWGKKHDIVQAPNAEGPRAWVGGRFLVVIEEDAG